MYSEEIAAAEFYRHKKKRTILVIFLKELPGKMGHEERKSTRFTAVFFTYLVNSSSASESDIPSF